MAERTKIFVRSSATYRAVLMLDKRRLITVPPNAPTKVYSGYPASKKTSSLHTPNWVSVGLLATNMKQKCQLLGKAEKVTKWNRCHAMLVHKIKQLRKICTVSKRYQRHSASMAASAQPKQGSIKFISRGTHGYKIKSNTFFFPHSCSVAPTPIRLKQSMTICDKWFKTVKKKSIIKAFQVKALKQPPFPACL